MLPNKIVKLAIVRENSTNKCPFGLDITDSCKCVGKLVNNMTSIIPQDNEQQKLTTSEIETLKDSNNRILMFAEEKAEQCKYANFIFEDRNMVECSFGDNGSGVGTINNLNSPGTLHQYLGVGFYSVPIGFYNQDLSYSDGFQNYVNQYFASNNNQNKIDKKASDDK